MHRRHYLQQNFSFSSCKTNRFHVTMGLYNNRSPNTSECDENMTGHTWLHAPHASHVFIEAVEFSNSVMVPQQYEIEISKQ